MTPEKKEDKKEDKKKNKEKEAILVSSQDSMIWKGKMLQLIQLRSSVHCVVYLKQKHVTLAKQNVHANRHDTATKHVKRKHCWL